MTSSYLEKRDPTRNQARYYRLAVLPNLFGEWTLAREWGRIGRGGRCRLDWYTTEVEAEGALLTLENSKRCRGYFLLPQQLPLF
jgi:predicted DNA-binding WGR domain protein